LGALRRSEVAARNLKKGELKVVLVIEDCEGDPQLHESHEERIEKCLMTASFRAFCENLIENGGHWGGGPREVAVLARSRSGS